VIIILFCFLTCQVAAPESSWISQIDTRWWIEFVQFDLKSAKPCGVSCSIMFDVFHSISNWLRRASIPWMGFQYECSLAISLVRYTYFVSHTTWKVVWTHHQFPTSAFLFFISLMFELITELSNWGVQLVLNGRMYSIDYYLHLFIL